MEENQNEEQFLDKYTKDKVEKGITELIEEKELKIHWRKELAENKSVQSYFEGFQPHSVESFVSKYILYKFIAHRYADMYSRKAEDRRSRWINKAHEHLSYIQQKKLFDLQCLWRAEQITLPEIEICYDFEVWGSTIFKCPFLEPITKEDIKQYQNFLMQSEEYYEFDTYTAQDYDDIKAEYLGTEEDYGIMPDWYEYHNLITGNSSLLLLPDIRGEKEEFYRSFQYKKNSEAIANAEPRVIDNRPCLSWHEEKDVRFFFTTFEDRETQLKFENYFEDKKTENRDSIDVDIILQDMMEQEETIPIDSHYDFKEAIIKAYVKFRNRKLAEHLEIAHEQYLFNLKMGFEIEQEKPLDRSIRKIWMQQILDGREANGEPRNLNF
ncbi:hypothetical protein WFZ85_07630 [Flavobacterium sp. j3]|uniref:Uncharacterized protein n=1 Tax=Flavobacterium aureirubrum TaxID=3133147 RepID=A0ABU9N7C0_9FLAO